MCQSRETDDAKQRERRPWPIRLALALLTEVAAAHALVLCEAPGEHVRVEASIAPGRCDTSDVGNARGASSELRLCAAPMFCIDTPLVGARLSSAPMQSPERVFKPAIEAAASSLPQPMLPPVFVSQVSVEWNGEDMRRHDLRSVILLV